MPSYHLHELETADPDVMMFRQTRGYGGPTLVEYMFTKGDTASRNVAYYRAVAWQQGHAAAMAELVEVATRATDAFTVADFLAEVTA